eukprot:Hpha_TRINITY_DN4380_c0_g1::TRINITY_DN4380_c0_g1_i1::g.50096::m.50096
MPKGGDGDSSTDTSVEDSEETSDTSSESTHRRPTRQVPSSPSSSSRGAERRARDAESETDFTDASSPLVVVDEGDAHSTSRGGSSLRGSSLRGSSLRGSSRRGSSRRERRVTIEQTPSAAAVEADCGATEGEAEDLGGSVHERGSAAADTTTSAERTTAEREEAPPEADPPAAPTVPSEPRRVQVQVADPPAPSTGGDRGPDTRPPPARPPAATGPPAGVGGGTPLRGDRRLSLDSLVAGDGGRPQAPRPSPQRVQWSPPQAIRDACARATAPLPHQVDEAAAEKRQAQERRERWQAELASLGRRLDAERSEAVERRRQSPKRVNHSP